MPGRPPDRPRRPDRGAPRPGRRPKPPARKRTAGSPGQEPRADRGVAKGRRPASGRQEGPGPKPGNRATGGRKVGARKFGARKKAAAPRPVEGRAATWGGLARRAAGRGGTAPRPRPADGVETERAPARGRLAGAGPSRAAEAFRDAGGAGGDVRRVAEDAVDRGAAPERTPVRRSRAPRRAPDAAALAGDLDRVVGKATAPKLAARLADAGRAFEAERYADARRILQPLTERAPGSAAVRELYGLTLYRLGRWADAVRELEAFGSLTGSTEQHPVLADCYRALGRYDEVEALWRELREASPSSELVAEGRIVYAGALGDRGLVKEAIAVIEPAVRKLAKTRRVLPHHLRLLYVLGDLYERAGDLPRARSLFDQVVAKAPGFADAAARRRSL